MTALELFEQGLTSEALTLLEHAAASIHPNPGKPIPELPIAPPGMPLPIFQQAGLLAWRDSPTEHERMRALWPWLASARALAESLPPPRMLGAEQ